MGEITDRFAIAFRDYYVDGVPASGPNKPRKSEIKAIGATIESRIAAAAAGLRTYETKAALDADTTRTPGTLAYVYKDPTPANNTVYHYETGGWVVDTAYYAGVAAAVQPVVDQVKVNPRPTTLSDINRNHVLIPKNATYFNSGAGQSGAIKVGLPTGIDARENTLRVLVRDHYGFLIFTFGGRNDSAWNYSTVDVQGQHSIIKDPDRVVQFGSDGNRACIWIGKTTYGFWDNLTVMVLDATFTGGPITEDWMGDWSVGLTSTIENSYSGMIPTYLPITSQYVKIDPTRYGMAMGIGAGLGTGASSYNFFYGHLAGNLLTTGFNCNGFGLQVLSEATTAQACTGMGTQALQHVTTAQQATAFGIHALLSNTTGFGNCAFGAGAMEYLTTAEHGSAHGTYAGRDNQFSFCEFWGQRAGLYGATADHQVWIGAITAADGTAYGDALIRGDKLNKTVKINGVLTTDGYRFSGDNTQSVGTPSNRASVIYAGTGAINTSDENMKTEISLIPDEWLDAWGEVEWCRFKFKDGNRWHIGLIAQRVHAAFEARGLDAFDIGLCCRDEWAEEREPIMELRPVDKIKQRPKLVDGVPQFEWKVLGELDGEPIREPVPVMEEYIEPIEQMFDTGETRVTRETGELWGLRYDECLAMEAAWNRRELARLKAPA